MIFPKKRCNASFSPVAGIQWVETPSQGSGSRSKESFSPVAGIQWVETLCQPPGVSVNATVSVPLPGFSGLRHQERLSRSRALYVSVPLPGFSGLRPSLVFTRFATLFLCFSPVAGIQWVETNWAYQYEINE